MNTASLIFFERHPFLLCARFNRKEKEMPAKTLALISFVLSIIFVT